MFDAYHKWLGIPPGRRPPTYYQLLGVDPTELDRDVIEAAAVRQTAYVRHFQAGAHAKECARILGELSQARLTLLDPTRRAAYDARLAESDPEALAPRTRPEAKGTARGESASVPPPALMAVTVAEPGTGGARGQRAAPRLLVPLVVTACALGGLAFAAFEYSRRPRTPTGGPVEKPGPVVVAPKAAGPPSTRTNPVVATTPGITGGVPGIPVPNDRTAVYDIGTEPPGAVLSATGKMPVKITPTGSRYQVEFPAADGKTTVSLDVILAGHEPFHRVLTPQPGEQRRLRIPLVPSRVATVAPPEPKKFVGMAKAAAPTGPARVKEEEVEAAATPHPEPTIIPEEAIRFEGMLPPIRCVAFHPKGTRVAAGGEDGKIRTWTRSGKNYKATRGHHVGWVNSLSFSPDGAGILSGGQDGTVRLWDAKLGLGTFVTRGDQHEVRFVAALSATQVIILTSDKVSVLELPAWKRMKGFDTNSPGKVLCMAVAPKARHVLVGDDTGELKLWSPETGRFVPNLFLEAPHDGEVAAVALAQDGERALSAGRGGSLRFWNFRPALGLRGSTETRLWRRDAGRIACLALSHDGRRALSGGDSVRLWDVEKGYETHILRGHADDVTAVAFSPDDRQALTGGADKTLRLWDLPDPEGGGAPGRGRTIPD